MNSQNQVITDLANQLRDAITYNLENFSYKNAIFMSDKLLTLVQSSGLDHLREEACWGLGCGYFGKREWTRAYSVFCQFLNVPRFFHMAAKCMVHLTNVIVNIFKEESGEWSQCIIVLGEDELEFSNKIDSLHDKKVYLPFTCN
jgi:hypothetical protein